MGYTYNMTKFTSILAYRLVTVMVLFVLAAMVMINQDTELNVKPAKEMQGVAEMFVMVDMGECWTGDDPRVPTHAWIHTKDALGNKILEYADKDTTTFILNNRQWKRVAAFCR